MLRAVLDTNLLVSYLLTHSPSISHLIEHWERANFTPIISPPMLAELTTVLQRPRLREKMVADPTALVDLLESEAEFVPGALTLSGVCRDPKDDAFIACAIEGQADYLVSRDEDLLALGEYQGVKKNLPEAFAELLDRSSSE
jgi:putative PIN family toxin of toxin-antitoxin system